MWAFMRTDITKVRDGLKQDIPRLIWQGKSSNKRRTCTEFYDKREHLYLEKDASRFGLADSLLQVRKGMNCLNNIALDNKILWPISFSKKAYPVLIPIIAT